MKKYLLFAASLSLATLPAQYASGKQTHQGQPWSTTATNRINSPLPDSQRTAANGSITFHNNGGSGSMETLTGLTEGEEFQLPRNTFTRTGYRFVGWTNTPGGNDPIFQDECPNFTYYSGSSQLYAVWEPEKTALQISFNANGGSGTMEPIYVRPNQTILVPPHRFTPSDEGYECLGYGTSAEDYARYRIGGTAKFTESCILYAAWSPLNGSIGGACEAYKGQTVFVDGVYIAPENWVQLGNNPVREYVEWKAGCGWYDVSQYWYNFCWAGTVSNAIHWWLDRNKKYVDKYRETHDLPALEYKGKGLSDVFNYFTKYWLENKGGFPNVGFNWFINGIDYGVQESAKGKGGLFKDVFGDNQLVTTSSQLTSRRAFNQFVEKALQDKCIVSINEDNFAGAHAITCWGFEFDDEGYIKTLYYTDSATPWDNTVTGHDYALSKITVKYDKEDNWCPYMETETLINGKIEYGRIPILMAYAYRQGTELWDAYFASQGQEKYTLVCQDAASQTFQTQTVNINPGSTISLPVYPFRTITKAMAGNKELTISAGGTINPADAEGETITLQYTDKLPFEVSTVNNDNFTDAHWYLLGNSSTDHSLMHYDAQNSNHIQTVSLAESNLSDEANLWCITGNVTNGFKLYNKKAGTGVAVTYTNGNSKATLQAADNEAAVWNIISSTAEGKENSSFCFQTKTTGNEKTYLSLANGEVSFSSTGDLTATLRALTHTEGISYAAIAFDNLLQNIPVGAVGGPADREATANAIATLKSSPTDANYQAVCQAFNNQTVVNTEKTYCLLGAGNKSAITVQKNGFFQAENVTALSANNLFLLEPIQNNRYSLKVQGEYLGAAKNNNAYNEFGLEGRSLNGTKFKKGEFSLVPETAARFYLQNTNTEANSQTFVHLNGDKIVGCSDKVEGTLWYLVEVPAIHVTIGESGYATVHFPFDVQLPQDGSLKAYTGTVSAEDNSRFILNELNGEWIPAHTAVILKGDAKTYTLTVSANADISSSEGNNELDGTFLPATLTAKDYILGSKNGVTGFYRVDENDRELGANKAYLPNSSIPASATNISSFIISFNGNSGGTTGIGSVSTEANAQEEYYDLQGRRVLNPAEGVYVTKSGKKVLIGK